MKTVRDVMTTDVVWLSPSNKVKTAIMLIKGHNIGGLPVADGGAVLGVVDYQDLLGKDNDIPVEHIMNREFVSIPADMLVADAADLMAKVGSGRLIVMDAGQMTGIVTRSDLMPELGKSFDPLTKLVRSDAMRDWGISALKRGDEISVIFIDLDDFGTFNKKYGHIIGDAVLKHVADVLQASVDEKTDLLCRYAGDEFVIVTVRNGDESRELAKVLEQRIRETPNDALPEPVTGSVGVHGGKRTKEREDTHYASTLDNLINLASKSCTLGKAKKGSIVSLNGGTLVNPAAHPPAEVATAAASMTATPGGFDRRLKIMGMNLSWEGGSLANAEIQLGIGDTVHSHSSSGFALGRNALRLVADSVAGAVCRFLSPGHAVVLDSVNLIDGGTGDDVVLVTAVIITPQTEMRVAGTSIVKQDAYRAAATAVLDAVNRQLPMILRAG